ncbi:hypothetical protein [Bradyrhizobium diazoefficiens]
MVELQPSRLVQTLHEGLHRAAIFAVQSEHMGTVERFLRTVRRKLVQRLVQIHHQPMEAVAGRLGNAGQARNAGKIDFIGGIEQTRASDGRQPRVRLVAVRRRAGADGADHGRSVVLDLLHQLGEVRRREPGRSDQMGAADQRCDRGWCNAGGVTLDRKLAGGTIGILRMPSRRLERTHPHFDAVIGGKPFRHQRGQQDVALSEFFDDLGFHGLSAQRLMPSLCREVATASLRQIIHKTVTQRVVRAAARRNGARSRSLRWWE